MNMRGYKTPVKKLSYQNCEICICHLDGYRSDRTALLKRMDEIEAEFEKSPVQAQFRLWFNIDENDLDKPTMESIAKSIARFQKHIYKIAFIGLQGTKKIRFDQELNKAFGQNVLVKAYFLDAELSKGWLV